MTRSGQMNPVGNIGGHRPHVSGHRSGHVRCQGGAVDDDQTVIDQASAPLEVDRPQPLWSEQDPESWWRATRAAMSELKAGRPTKMGAVKGIGLSGSDAWRNTCGCREQGGCARRSSGMTAGRRRNARSSNAGCRIAGVSRAIWRCRASPLPNSSGSPIMSRYLFKGRQSAAAEGLCAASHDRRLCLRYVRQRWHPVADVAHRRWSGEMLAATGLPESAMPTLFEGSQSTGTLRPEIAAEWGVPASAVVAGVPATTLRRGRRGRCRAGRGIPVAGNVGCPVCLQCGLRPNPEQAVHAFCHCLPDTWHQMSVILSAASCLTWLSGVLGTEVPALMDEVATADRDTGNLIFLPYLTGERTPHNDPNAMGVFFGLTGPASVRI